MNIKTETVAGPMAKGSAEPVPFEDPTGGGVNGGRLDSGPHGSDCRQLRVEDRPVNPTGLRGGSPYG